MAAASPRDRKASVPSPLPTRRGEPYIPRTLSDRVTEALVSTNSAIPKLQAELKSTLHKNKWDDAVRAHLLDVLRTSEGERKSDDEVSSAVVASVMAGLTNRGADVRSSGKEGHTSVEIPQAAVDEAVRVVRNQLDTVCAVVDYVDWEGVEG